MDLQGRGEKQMAEQLAKAVVSGSKTVSVTLDGENQVVVDHDRFHGTHDITTDESGDHDVAQWGEYEFTGNDDQFDIQFEAPNQYVVEKAHALLDRRTRSDADSSESDSSESNKSSRPSLVDRLLHR